MEITEEQYEQVAHLFPVPRGNVKLSNLQVLNAVLYLAEQGCKWRGLPERYGHWHTIYNALAAVEPAGGAGSGLCRAAGNRSSAGALGSLGAGQYQCQSASGCYGGAEKKGPQALGKSHGGRNTKVHVLAADDRTALAVALSPGQAHDGVEGRKLLTLQGQQEPPDYLLMDRAYEGNVTR